MALYFGSTRISDVTIPMAPTAPKTINAGETPVICKLGKYGSTSTSEYTEMTDSAITITRAGTYRIKFSCVNLYNSFLTSVGYAQIWVNHAAREDGETFSIMKQSNTEIFQYSEDIELAYGDVITIALKSASSTYGTVCMGIAACIDWDNGF